MLNVTDSPGLIVIVAGMKQFGSQPGLDDPSAFSTVFAAVVVVGAGVGSGSGSVGVALPSPTIIVPNIHG